MKVSERLIIKIKKDLGLNVTNLERIPRGRHQASAGQFVWTGKLSDGYATVGSENTMTECVTADYLSCYRPIEFSDTINITAEVQP